MSTELNPAQMRDLVDQFVDIALDGADDGARYAEDFARLAAGFAAAALIDPASNPLGRFRAMARAAAETVTEIGDQAAERLALRFEDVLRGLLIVLRTAI
ncbi:MAG: hypothetical protein AAFU73_23985 [Planctomycetota bacterium]